MILQKLVKSVIGDQPRPTVRAIRNEDVPSIVRTEIVNFNEPASATAFYGLIGTAYPRSVWIGTLGVSDEAIGYVVCETNDYCVVVRSISVNPYCQGFGVGRALLDFVCGRYAGGKPVEVYVPEIRVGAQRFFAGCGFQCYATIDRYYSDNSNAFAFRKGRKPISYFGHCESLENDRPRPRTAPGNRK